MASRASCACVVHSNIIILRERRRSVAESNTCSGVRIYGMGLGSVGGFKEEACQHMNCKSAVLTVATGACGPSPSKAPVHFRAHDSCEAGIISVEEEQERRDKGRGLLVFSGLDGAFVLTGAPQSLRRTSPYRATTTASHE